MIRQIKSAKITIPRKEAILAIKRDLHYTLPIARQIVDNFSEHLVGKDYDDLGDMWRMYDWCEIVLEEVYSEEEIEYNEKLHKAQKWYDSLSAEDKEHYKVIAASMHPHAVS